MNIAAAKKIDLVEYLASFGFNPSKIRKGHLWYLSPLRDERTASFKVDRQQNVWYDHGLSKGCNFIDLAVLYYNCSVKELLEKARQRPFFSPAICFSR